MPAMGVKLSLTSFALEEHQLLERVGIQPPVHTHAL